jgi:hypothetical protein
VSCIRCGGPETGEPLCRRCEAAVEYEQNLDDELEIGRPVAPGACFLAQFSDKPCEGRLIRAHLIPRQVIRRELGGRKHGYGWTTIADDPRCWVWACGGALGPSGHHGMLDHSRTLRIPREALPAGIEAFAEEYGLGWWLDRTYGPVGGIAI